MARQELEKIVATQALEAIKEVLQHLQNWSVQLEERGEQRSRDMTQLYGQVRRLRDYMNRSIGAHTHPVELDLEDIECNVLASCCVYALEGIAKDLKYDRGLTEHDKSWLVDKRNNLSLLVQHMATEEVKVIPSPGGPRNIAPEVRRVLDQVRARFTRRPEPSEQRVKQATAPLEAPSSNQPKEDDTNIVTGAWTGGWSGKRNPLPTQTVDEKPGGPPPPDITIGAEIDSSQSAVEPPLEPIVENEPSLPPIGLHDGDLEALEYTVRAEAEINRKSLNLDSRMVKDPRLRTMLVLDVRALDRSRAAKDYRLASVHLCSVFEAIVVDGALARRSTMQLSGTPETWRLDEIVRDLLGDRFTTADRATLYHLIACRNLIRPAVQLHNPIVVTRGSLEKMLEFVQRVVFELGLCGSTSLPG